MRPSRIPEVAATVLLPCCLRPPRPRLVRPSTLPRARHSSGQGLHATPRLRNTRAASARRGGRCGCDGRRGPNSIHAFKKAAGPTWVHADCAAALAASASSRCVRHSMVQGNAPPGARGTLRRRPASCRKRDRRPLRRPLREFNPCLRRADAWLWAGGRGRRLCSGASDPGAKAAASLRRRGGRAPPVRPDSGRPRDGCQFSGCQSERRPAGTPGTHEHALAHDVLLRTSHRNLCIV